MPSVTEKRWALPQERVPALGKSSGQAGATRTTRHCCSQQAPETWPGVARALLLAVQPVRAPRLVGGQQRPERSEREPKRWGPGLGLLALLLAQGEQRCALRPAPKLRYQRGSGAFLAAA